MFLKEGCSEPPFETCCSKPYTDTTFINSLQKWGRWLEPEFFPTTGLGKQTWIITRYLVSPQPREQVIQYCNSSHFEYNILNWWPLDHHLSDFTLHYSHFCPPILAIWPFFLFLEYSMIKAFTFVPSAWNTLHLENLQPSLELIISKKKICICRFFCGNCSPP